MDIRITKINIYSNSDEPLEFLKTREINNYMFHFGPLVQKKEKTEFCIKDNTYDEIDVLVLNSDLLNDYDEYMKWYGGKLKDKYDFVFLYGNYQPIYNKDLDIHFKDFDIFKDFFEVFYYLLNGTDYCSIDLRDLIYSFGSRPYGLKCFTSKDTDEIIDSLNKFNREINALLYVEKVPASFSLCNLNNEFYQIA